MSYTSQRFRNTAAQTKVSDMAAADLKVEKLIPLVATHLTKKFLDAVASGLDLNNPLTVWSLLHVDGVIRLENVRGETLRVAVAFAPQDNKAFSLFSMAKSSAAIAKVRHLLNIDQYWVFCVDDKHFPTQEEWIDILYSQVDLPVEDHSCKLIKL